jgi:hypothetical protein
MQKKKEDPVTNSERCTLLDLPAYFCNHRVGFQTMADLAEGWLLHQRGDAVAAYAHASKVNPINLLSMPSSDAWFIQFSSVVLPAAHSSQRILSSRWLPAIGEK